MTSENPHQSPKGVGIGVVGGGAGRCVAAQTIATRDNTAALVHKHGGHAAED